MFHSWGVKTKDRWEPSRTFQRSPACTQHPQANPCSATSHRAGRALWCCRRRGGTRKPRWPLQWPISSKPVSLWCPQFTPACCSWHRHGPGSCPGGSAHGRLQQHPALERDWLSKARLTLRLCSTARQRARYWHVRLTQHQNLHPAGSAQGPGEALIQQPGQGQDSPSCLFLYRASSQHQEYDSFFSSRAFHTCPISVPQPGHVSRKEKLDQNKNRGFQNIFSWSNLQMVEWAFKMMEWSSKPSLAQASSGIKHVEGLLGCPVQGQELDLMILVGPFQPSRSCDSVISK